MHGLDNSGLGVPAFLAKLWRLVEDQETNSLISWGQDGRSFIIQNQAKFAKELLPLNYKHNNMASFIRQLNMYGFHKITSIDNGGLKFDRDEMEFSHPYFQKGHPYLLEHIKRKIANPKQAEADKAAASKSETISRVLSEVKNMRGRQETLDSRFSAMKTENEALWREVAILRQKHMKQQQIVNKLIQFLVTLVQPQRSGLGSGIGKRRYQLMINEAPQSKVKKTNEGPIISELTEELLDDVADSDLDEGINFHSVQSPGSHSSKDIEGSASSVDAIDAFSGMDDIDEIDTNNMEIYSGVPVKKERRSARIFQSANAPSGSNEAKKETQASEQTVQQQTIQAGKSLLKQDQKPIADSDIVIKILNQEDMPSDSNNGAAAASLLSPNTVNSLTGGINEQLISPLSFDETSQNDNMIDNDELYNLIQNKDDASNSENNSELTKYNPNHAEDISGLQTPSDYSGHLENVQMDLESLKDLLANDAYQLDANQLLGNNNGFSPYNTMPFGSYDMDTISKIADDAALQRITQDLFGNEDLVGYEMSPSNIANMDLFASDDKKNDQSPSKSDVIAYQPSPYNNNLDLNELLQNVDDNRM